MLLSDAATPPNTSRPCPMLPTMLPSTVTAASRTRCTSALMWGWVNQRNRTLALAHNLTLDAGDLAADQRQSRKRVGITRSRHVRPASVQLAMTARGGIRPADLGDDLRFGHADADELALGCAASLRHLLALAHADLGGPIGSDWRRNTRGGERCSRDDA